MAFRGKYPIRSKIVITETVTEQISHFRYLGYDIIYDSGRDINKKIVKLQDDGTIPNTKRCEQDSSIGDETFGIWKGIYTQGRLRNAGTRRDFQIFSLNSRMTDNRFFKQILSYKPKGKRPLGNPESDSLILLTGTGESVQSLNGDDDDDYLIL